MYIFSNPSLSVLTCLYLALSYAFAQAPSSLGMKSFLYIRAQMCFNGSHFLRQNNNLSTQPLADHCMPSKWLNKHSSIDHMDFIKLVLKQWLYSAVICVH